VPALNSTSKDYLHVSGILSLASRSHQHRVKFVFAKAGDTDDGNLLPKVDFLVVNFVSDSNSRVIRV
jgi:hypothetical protein